MSDLDERTRLVVLSAILVTIAVVVVLWLLR